METLMSRWSLNFDYYWPYLEILHNPPSQIHWLKALHALEASKFETNIHSIPPCLVIAGARYGMAKLGNSAALKDIAINTILDPMEWKNWRYLLDQSELALMLYLKDQAARTSATGIKMWRPLGFEAPVANFRASNTTTHLFSCKSNPELEVLQEKALNYLEHLRQVHFDHVEVRSILARVNLGVIFKPTALNTIEKADRKCAICFEDMLDPEDAGGHLREAALQQLDMAKKRFSFLDAPEVLDEWTQRLKENIRFDLQAGLAKWDKAVLKELTQFTYGLIYAYHQRDTLVHSHSSDTCIGPIKLDCGHVFGLRCIETWLQENLTCPCCRRNLSPVAARREAIYHHYQPWIQQARGQQARLLQEFPTSHPSFEPLIVQLHRRYPLLPDLLQAGARETSPILRQVWIEIAQRIQLGAVSEALMLELWEWNYPGKGPLKNNGPCIP